MLRSQFSKRASVSLAVLSLAALGACSTSSDESQPSDPTPEETSVEEAPYFSLLPTDIQESGEIAVGAPFSLRPSIFTDDDGEPTGIAVDISVAIGELLGVDLVWQESDDPVTALQSGAIDVSMGYLSDSPSREEVLTMIPMYLNTSTLLVDSDSDVTDIETMCGATLAVVSGAQQELTATQVNDEYCADDPIEILTFPSASEALTQVQSGRADAFVAPRMILEGVVAGSDGALAVTEADYTDYPFAMGFAKDNTELAEAFLAAMTSIVEDGTYAEILAEWDQGDIALTIDQVGINAGSTSAFPVNQ